MVLQITTAQLVNCCLMQRTIALIQTAFLGDTALAMLFAEQVRRAFPAEQLVFVCRPDGESLARANPAITDTLVYDKRGRDRGIHGIWHIAHALRMRNTEIIFCLQRSIRTAIVARWSGARRRIGFATADGAWLFTDRVPYRNDLHEIERNALLLSALGIEPPPDTSYPTCAQCNSTGATRACSSSLQTRCYQATCSDGTWCCLGNKALAAGTVPCRCPAAGTIGCRGGDDRWSCGCCTLRVPCSENWYHQPCGQTRSSDHCCISSLLLSVDSK